MTEISEATKARAVSAEHTPGPWLMAAKPSSVVGWPIVAPADGGRLVCKLNYADKRAEFGLQPGERKFNHVSEANGRLIAAAPELLEALSNLAAQAGGLSAFEHEIRDAVGNTNWQCVVDAVAKADAAIAKARGQ